MYNRSAMCIAVCGPMPNCVEHALSRATVLRGNGLGRLPDVEPTEVMEASPLARQRC